MSEISRRAFVAGAAAAGALASLGCRNVAKVQRPVSSDLVVANGPDIEKNIRAAVDEMGGMGTFVSSGQTVGILVNILGAIPAAHTKPEVIKAVVEMCRDAGAGEVGIMDWREMSRWEQNKLIKTVEELKIKFNHISMDDESLWRSLDIPRGKAINKVRVFNALYEPDVFIMLPLMKHHGGARFTGALKIYMGTTHRMDNRTIFHRERGRYLEQCIADLNTVVRPPDLIIMDGMEVITARGPVGPGPVTRPNKIIAGFDRVAIDAYAVPIQGVDPADSVQIKGAYEHGVGEMDLNKINVKELQVG